MYLRRNRSYGEDQLDYLVRVMAGGMCQGRVDEALAITYLSWYTEGIEVVPPGGRGMLPEKTASIFGSFSTSVPLLMSYLW